MAEYSFPFDQNTGGDASRQPYSAASWATLQQYLNGPAVRQSDYGVYRLSNATVSDAYKALGLMVAPTSPATAQVQVQPGSAQVQGRLYVNDSTLNLTIAGNASGNPRIDLIVLRYTIASNTVRAAVLQGTAAATPVPPSLTQNASVWEIAIAEVLVASGFVTLTEDTITPRRNELNTSDSVVLDNIVNNTGGDLEHGDVVVLTNGQAALPTAASGAPMSGIWQSRTANGGRGRLLTRGISLVKTTSTPSAGNRLVTSATQKKADTATAQSGVVDFGHVLAAFGTTRALAYVDVRRPQNAGGTVFTAALSWTNAAFTTQFSFTAEAGVTYLIFFSGLVSKSLAPRFKIFDLGGSVDIYNPGAVTAAAVSDYVNFFYLYKATAGTNVAFQATNGSVGTTSVASGASNYGYIALGPSYLWT